MKFNQSKSIISFFVLSLVLSACGRGAAMSLKQPVVDQNPIVIDTPTPTPSPTPIDSPTPTPSPTPIDSPTPPPSPTPIDSPTPTPSPTVVPPTPTPSPTVVPPTPTPSPTVVPPTPTPSPTVVPPTPTPSPTVVPPTPTPVPSSYLSLHRKPTQEVSAKSTFAIDPRVWLASGWVRSSSAIYMSRYDSSQLSGGRQVLDENGRLVAIEGLSLRDEHKPGSKITVAVTIHNIQGRQLEVDLELKIVKAFVRFNISSVKVGRAKGTFEFNVAKLYEQGKIKSSSSTVIMTGFGSDLPLSGCENQMDANGNLVGIKCEKAELKKGDCYQIKSEIAIPEGESDSGKFEVQVVD